MSTKKKAKPDKAATERLRKAAIAEIKQRLDAPQPSDATASLHEGSVIRGDGQAVHVSVPADQPETPTGEAEPESTQADPSAAGRGTDATVPVKSKKGGKAKATPKTPKLPKPAREKKPKRVSLLDVAVIILASAPGPMSAKEIVADVLNKKLWSTKGKTPEATLYAAMIREIAAKKGEARFKKVDRGLFVVSAAARATA